MPPSSIPPKIFISYRREDSAVYAHWLYQSLSNHFGKDQIFIDKNSIEVGEDFERKIEDAVSKSEILIAIIGKQWFLRNEKKDSRGWRWGTNKKGERRIDDPRDMVRLEIAAALDREISVVPILVQGAKMPTIKELPEALRKLPPCNAFVYDESNWETDIQELIQTLEGILAKAPETRRTRKREEEERRQRELREKQAEEEERRQREEQDKQQAVEAERQGWEAERRGRERQTERLKLRLKNLALSVISFVVIYGIFTQLPQWMKDSSTRFARKAISYVSSTPSPSPSPRTWNQDWRTKPLLLPIVQPTPTPKPSPTPEFINSSDIEFYMFSSGGTSFPLGERVTRSQWEQVMGKSPNSPPLNQLTLVDDFLFFEVSKRNAQMFVKRLNLANENYTYRLPTAAERQIICPVPIGVLPCDNFWVASDPGTSTKGVRVIATRKPFYISPEFLSPEMRKLLSPERPKVIIR